LTIAPNGLDTCQDSWVIPSTRSRRSPVDRFDERRIELAESALLTLGELGYARTSLRDIASNSPFSHGVLHYYFDDKLDLVSYSITHHKMRCVHRYDEVVEQSTTTQQLLDGFAAKLVETLVEEAPMHRLWYDLRVESMFDERLRETVLRIDAALQDMIWRIVTRYSELADRGVAMDPASAYGVLDGLFQAALLGHVTGNANALSTLVDQVHALMPLTLGPLPRAVSNPVDSFR
jgi:TetR/AcrR family transcriptional regulator, transcriptional repressor of bet genes